MSKRTSIGSWAYTIGPYANIPSTSTPSATAERTRLRRRRARRVPAASESRAIPTVPTTTGRARCRRSRSATSSAKMKAQGLGFSGIAANLWGEKLINTDDQIEVHRRVPKELRVRARSRHSGHSRRLRAAADDPSRSRLRDRDGSRGPHMEDLLPTSPPTTASTSTWEFEPGFAFNKPSDVVRIHDAVNKPNFGLQYDTCHGQMVGVAARVRKAKRKSFPTRSSSSASCPAASITFT